MEEDVSTYLQRPESCEREVALISYHVRADFDPTKVKSVYANNGYDFRGSGFQWPYSPKGGVWTSEEEHEQWMVVIGVEWDTENYDPLRASKYAVEIEDDTRILEVSSYEDQQLFLMEYQLPSGAIHWLKFKTEWDAIRVTGQALSTSTFSLWQLDTLLIVNTDKIIEFVLVEKGDA